MPQRSTHQPLPITAIRIGSDGAPYTVEQAFSTSADRAGARLCVRASILFADLVIRCRDDKKRPSA
jgi:hypothetical protein